MQRWHCGGHEPLPTATSCVRSIIRLDASDERSVLSNHWQIVKRKGRNAVQQTSFARWQQDRRVKPCIAVPGGAGHQQSPTKLVGCP